MLLLILLYVLLLPTVTFSKNTSHSNQTTNQNSAKSNRNPTIRISRATRGLQWDSSLDQEVTDSKELRNLDEFLGNQVRSQLKREKEQVSNLSLNLHDSLIYTINVLFSGLTS